MVCWNFLRGLLKDAMGSYEPSEAYSGGISRLSSFRNSDHLQETSQPNSKQKDVQMKAMTYIFLQVSLLMCLSVQSVKAVLSASDYLFLCATESGYFLQFICA